MSAQPNLFPLRITSRYPQLVNGADVSFCCNAGEEFFYCKVDRDDRAVRATEWLFTHLARHLGILVPDCAILEDPITGETVFGSRQVESPASEFDAKIFLSTPQQGDFGQPSEWPGAYLSRLYAFDLFAGNVDRGLNNFFVVRDGMSQGVCAFDFASGRLVDLDGRRFPIESDPTVRVGKFLRHTHGFYTSAANEMIDRIAAVPSETIAGFLKQMPDDWMSTEQREKICELWSARQFGGRILALRTGIADESLL